MKIPNPDYGVETQLGDKDSKFIIMKMDVFLCAFKQLPEPSVRGVGVRFR